MKDRLIGLGLPHDPEFAARVQSFTAVHAHVRGCATKRYHTEPTLQNETVGAHVGFMVGAAFIIYDTPSLALLKAISLHDHMEAITGDMPAPMKVRRPELKAIIDELEMEFHGESKLPGWPMLDAHEERQLKVLDRLSGVACASQELRMGNWSVHHVLGAFCGYFATLKPEWKELYFFEGLLDTAPNRNRAVPDDTKRLFEAMVKSVREAASPKYRTNPKPDGMSSLGPIAS
jgi:5'-deoxynucleotidase YfbR-like HD superfamily hydrolase